MKIGVMTWFHYLNYGTALQLTALCHTLKNMGHSVQVINYKPNITVSRLENRSIFKEYFDKIPNKIKNRGLKHYTSEGKENLFYDFYNQLSFTDEVITLSDFQELNDKFDFFVCGSDQIWSPVNFNPRYFLDFVTDKNKMIAYAPSLGVSSFNDEDVKEQICNLVNRFKFVSVREQQGLEMLQPFVNVKVNRVLDPTFLLSDDEWNTYTSKETIKEKYLLTYFLGKNDTTWKYVNEIANKYKLKIKVIPVFESDLSRDGCIKQHIGPSQFLNLIKNASYVCTDSFHGVTFSINFKRQFSVFERFNKKAKSSQNSRIYNILKIGHLEDRLIKDKSQLNYIDKIDYEKVYNALNKEKVKSLSYLKNSLNSKLVCNSKFSKVIGNEIDLCCGCGACDNVCPVKAIKIERNKDGFFNAKVDKDICIECGQCYKVCSFKGKNNSMYIKDCNLYSYKSKDKCVLMKSSSGGFAFDTAKYFNENGYAIVGCHFNIEKECAEHILIEPNSVEKLYLLQGSKYMQSDFTNVIEQILNCQSPIVVFGTPCEIAGLKKLLEHKRIIKEIIYIDIIFHGVPSYNLWKKYEAYLCENYGIKPGTIHVNFRDKDKGWRTKYIKIRSDNKFISQYQDNNYYFKMFEACNAFSKACYECRWRDKSEADIRIGDYWGDKFSEDKTGVNMVITMTSKGNEIIRKLSYLENAVIQEQDINDYFISQQTINIAKPVYYDRLMKNLNSKSVAIEEIDKEFVEPIIKRRKISSKIQKMKSVIKK